MIEYKTPGYYSQQILSVMSNSDIAIMIGDKRTEWGWLEGEKKIAMKGYRKDNRKIVELLYLDEQEELNKLIRSLQYSLKVRTSGDDDNIDIQELKNNVSIIEVIETITGIRIQSTYRLIRCPLHKDNTASLKIYKNTNSFYCQGCSRGGSSIDFIKYYYNTTIREAINKLIKFYNK